MRLLIWQPMFFAWKLQVSSLKKHINFLAGVRYRSIVGSLLQAPWALGYALLAFVAYLTKSWDTIQMVTVIMHVLSIGLLHMLPESPRLLTFFLV